MDVRGRIDTILSVRKTKAAALEKKKEELASFEQTVQEKISAIQNAAYAIADPAMQEQYSMVVGGIYAGPLMDAIYQMNEAYEAGVERFSREYISVATVGKERQGKSQFLQSVSDLDNDIIPAYDATSCTGATSVIWNDPDMAAGTVKAVISFRQPQDLVDIANAYINQIDPGFLPKPLEFAGIGTLNLPGLRQRVENGDVVQANAFTYLTKIVQHFNEIRKLFGQAPLTLYDKNEIKTYVAQNNGRSVSDKDYKAWYSYLAVSRADIYCQFHRDVGRLRLVDTIGIGTTQVGAERAMLETVDRECDAAIVVTRPISGIQTSDIDLYNSLRDQFAGRDTSKWLFYLVNHFAGQNDNTVQAFHDDVYKNNFAVADCRVIDNSDQEMVQDGFLMPLLEKLLHNMDAIDDAYMQTIRGQEKLLQQAVGEFQESLKDLDSLEGGNQIGKDAYVRGEKCFKKLAADLKNLVIEWGRKKRERNALLWNRVQAILNNLDSLIPSAEQINEISRNNGHMTGSDIWEMCLHHVRNRLTDQFIAIDDVLEEETLRFKNSLVETLYVELQQMSGGTPEDGEDVDMVEWLKDITEKYLSGNEQYAQITKAFDFLYKFEFNTRAQLIQEVRRQLYIINPICDAEYAQPQETFPMTNCGEAVYFYLTSRMSIIEDELRYHLGKLYRTPNEAFYAAAEEFYDRLVFSSNITGAEVSDMGYVWGSFFQEFSQEIWKEQAQMQEQVQLLVASYKEMKRTLEAFIGKRQPDGGAE